MHVDATFSQLVWLIALAIAMQLAFNYSRVGPQGELWLYGLPNLLFKVPVILVAAWAISLMSGKRDKTLQLIVATSAIAIPVYLFSRILLVALSGSLSRTLFKGTDIYYALYSNMAPAWLSLAAVVAAVRLLELRPRQIGAAILPGALLIWMPLAQVNSDQTLWMVPYDPESFAREQMQRDALLAEDAFYVQARLLDRTLASLDGSPADRIGLYFVGVAGYSDQDVFMKEVRYVANFFKAHFDTRGHSVTLINNPKTVLESPIASITSLRRTLMQVGKIMDTEKDILFLYLTSHGSRNHQFSLDFGSMRLNALTPSVLRKIIDDSGIKRRIVIVSACYSGAFAEPLQDSNTLVITAAASDKQSHGCSDDAYFTFFGKAYFEGALRRTDSFIEAFGIAKSLIAEREARDGYESAEPRMFVGDEIRKALRQLAAERHARGLSEQARR